ncbi:hypothetical protein ACERK3_14150 [Phycisphaerales bacterium AB-hyl4]|uniref:Uncharacterized protein n=1 Tax=Natronomicrosphaera hydrolytica TaxID=3242702 RepID=A0ABV4U9E0_9BACT
MAYLEVNPTAQKSKSKCQSQKYDVFAEAAWHVLSPYIDLRDCNRLVPRKNEDGTIRYDTDGRAETACVPLNTIRHWRYAADGRACTYGEDGRIVPVAEVGHDPDALVGRCRFTFVGRSHFHEHLHQVNDPFGVPKVLYYRSAFNAQFRLGRGKSTKNLALAPVPYAKLLDVQTGVVRSSRLRSLLITIDFDFKPIRYPNAVNDAAATCQWFVGRFFPGAYHEPSTGGNGRHLYLKVAYEPRPNPWMALADMVDGIGRWLQWADVQRQDQGFVTNVDPLVCGAPSLIHYAPDGSIEKIVRPQCVKMPSFGWGRPMDERLNAVKAFHEAPVFLLTAFDCHSLSTTTPCSLSPPNRCANPPVGAAYEEEGGAEDRAASNAQLIEKYREHGLCEWHEVNRRPRKRARTPVEELEGLREMQDAKERTRRFYALMCRQHDRVLAPNEVNDLYVEHALNRTADHERRLDLFRGQEEWFQEHFRPALNAMPSMEGFSKVEEAYSNAIESLLPANLGYTKSKGRGKKTFKRIAAREVAAIFYAIEVLSRRRGGGFLGYREAVTLYKEMIGKSADQNRIGVILRTLQEIRLIDIVAPGDWQTAKATVYRPCRSLNTSQ